MMNEPLTGTATRRDLSRHEVAEKLKEALDSFRQMGENKQAACITRN
jgi:hypothetical protein